MRWTDLPRDHEPAGEPPVLRRGDWEDLRQRLERLPAGHPSAPDDRDDAAADDADAGWAEQSAAGKGQADQGRGAEVGDQPTSREGQSRPDGRARPDGSAGSGGQDAARASGLDRPGRGEPYRPWFTSGESPFWADPGA
jgi:hypothetical protein